MHHQQGHAQPAGRQYFWLHLYNKDDEVYKVYLMSQPTYTPPDTAPHTSAAPSPGPARGQEITYAEFVSPAFWGRITRALGRQSFSKEQRAAMRAPLVYQEIMSYIKGSAEALEAGGSLSLAQYKEVRAGRMVAGPATKHCQS
jgi:hypothetical protein